MSKYKPATFVFGVEERENANFFKLLQLEQFGEEKKSLKTEKEVPKGPQVSFFLDEHGLIPAKNKIGKSQLVFNAKHLMLLHWYYHVVELYLRNEHKDNQHEGTNHVRKLVQQKMWIPGIRNAKDLTRTSVLPAEKAELKL